MTNTTPDLHLVILAAGKGTRMRTRRAKLLHRIGGLTLIDRVVRIARGLSPASITLVVGHQADDVRALLSQQDDLQFVVQEPQLGTGHAVLQTEPLLAGRIGTMVLLSGDVPLLRTATLADLVAHHHATGSTATLLTAAIDRPYGYGRIVRRDGRITRVVEERDATPAQRRITEINSGIYAFALAPLFDALRGIATGNSQGEYYLPDLVTIYRRRGLPVETLPLADATEVRGVNSQNELAELGVIVREKKNAELMAAGVTLLDPATTYIDADVVVGADTVIHPNVCLEGTTRVGSACEIHASVRIIDSTVADGAVVRNFCVLDAVTVASGAIIGPFAHLRPGSDVREQAHVGNFVELKKTTLGARSKANHLAYLGDATIGEGVNVGAGTITCNYDGRLKHPTVIEDGAFIGSDSQLIAPVRIGRGAYVAAGSSITKDVPEGALAVARARQENKAGWADRKRTRK